MGDGGDLSDRTKRGAWQLRDFFVDFFGSLVPGLIFTIITGTILIWGTLLVYDSGRVALCTAPIASSSSSAAELHTVEATAEESAPAYAGAQRLFGRFRFEIVVLLVVASYVIGHLFYRCPPKKPDEHSAKRVWDQLIAAARAKEEVRAAEKIEEAARKYVIKNDSPAAWKDDDGEFDVQFPYLYIGEYLDHRGLRHLAEFIPWWRDTPGSTKEQKMKRTKMFINILKIRLQFLVPERCGLIARNEAHVRLMSSIWYATMVLRTITLVGFLLAAVALRVSVVSVVCGRIQSATIALGLQAVCFAFCNAVVLVGMVLGRMTIEKFLHYQRVREVVYVLETAHYADRLYPGKKILDRPVGGGKAGRKGGR